MPELSAIRTWIFDLDNTLYPPEAALFAQIETRMTAWVMRELGLPHAEADRLRVDYWRRYGTTLAGLMREHGISPDGYLHEVHDIAFDTLLPDAALLSLIPRLPGRRIVFTNGTGPYAEKVLEARGLAGAFDAIYGIEHADYASKPERAAYEAIAALDRFDPATAAFFEDTAENLRAPHEMGMATIHVASLRAPGDHVHHHAPDLSAFLSQIVP